MVNIIVKQGDVKRVYCDVLVMKHANAFYGADREVSQAIGFNDKISEGAISYINGKNIVASSVLYIGVGDLRDFRYEQIRKFSYHALTELKNIDEEIKIIATTTHGAGYGLDEQEAFLSLIAGFIDGLSRNSYPSQLESIIVVEQNKHRASRLDILLKDFLSEKLIETARQIPVHNRYASRPIQNETLNARHMLSSYGQESESKPKIFVAMPFADEFHDEWELAIQEAGNSISVLCERIDEQSYTGDILNEIKNRITKSCGLIALLNQSNPNVFLEIGYAWASGKPTVLLLKQGNALPFDVRGQKCIMYKNVADLKKKLSEELKNLRVTGVFGKDARG